MLADAVIALLEMRVQGGRSKLVRVTLSTHLFLNSMKLIFVMPGASIFALISAILVWKVSISDSSVVSLLSAACEGCETRRLQRGRTCVS